MTPADIAKVREFVECYRQYDHLNDGDGRWCPKSTYPERPCDCRKLADDEVVAILDAEAKKKTRTIFCIASKETGAWQLVDDDDEPPRTAERQRERVAELHIGPTKHYGCHHDPTATVVEVTESWEEPT